MNHVQVLPADIKLSTAVIHRQARRPGDNSPGRSTGKRDVSRHSGTEETKTNARDESLASAFVHLFVHLFTLIDSSGRCHSTRKWARSTVWYRNPPRSGDIRNDHGEPSPRADRALSVSTVLPHSLWITLRSLWISVDGRARRLPQVARGAVESGQASRNPAPSIQGLRNLEFDDSVTAIAGFRRAEIPAIRSRFGGVEYRFVTGKRAPVALSRD